jgi:hypothetical protein
MIPMVWYNGTHRVANGISIYGSSRGFMLGLFQFSTPLGSSATAYPSATINQYYDECWGPNSGEHTRFSGIDTINGGSLTQCYGTQYINWAGSEGSVDAQILSALQINGNQNTFKNTKLRNGYVTDNGWENSVQAGVNDSDPNVQRRFYNNPTPPQEPVGKLDGGFLAAGASNSPFISVSDLLTTCRDYRFATAGSATVSCVNDPAGPEISKSYLKATGTSLGGFGTGYAAAWSSLFTLGGRVPLANVYVITQGRCEGSAACSASVTFSDLTASTTLGSCNLAFGASWTTIGGPTSAYPCALKLTGAIQGHVIGWNTNSWTGSGLIAVDLGILAFEPVNADVRASIVLSGASSSWNNGGASINANSCVNGPTVQIAGATTGMAANVMPVANPGLGLTWNNAYVTSGSNVQIVICNSTSSPITPTSTSYNIRMIQ